MATKQRLNVLVVDRDEGSNIAIKDFLTERGYQAHVVTEPSEVMAEIKRGRFQLVLLDVSPPEPGGLDLLQQIREADSDICMKASTSSGQNQSPRFSSMVLRIDSLPSRMSSPPARNLSTRISMRSAR